MVIGLGSPYELATYCFWSRHSGGIGNSVTVRPDQVTPLCLHQQLIQFPVIYVPHEQTNMSQAVWAVLRVTLSF